MAENGGVINSGSFAFLVLFCLILFDLFLIVIDVVPLMSLIS